MSRVRVSMASPILSAFVLVAFGFAPEALRPWIAGVALVLFCASLTKPGSAPSVWSLFVGATVSLKTFLPAFDTWPLHIALPLLLAWAYSSLAPGPSPRASWAALGAFGPGIKIATAIVAVAAVAVLILWTNLVQPDLRPQQALRRLSPAALLVMACAFASANAALEELAFRGIALHALVGTSMRPWLSVVLQAVAFGALHYTPHSIPNGPPGAVLTCVFGLALGSLARVADGILAPSIAHFVADLAVFVLMARNV